MPQSNSGTCTLVVTPIGNLSEISGRSLDILRCADVIACEDTRNTVKLLSHYDIHTHLITYHNFNEENSAEGIISLLKEGKNIALVSDAGYPLISDPGYVLVQRLIEEDLPFTIAGSNNAALSALLGSGLDTTHYLFYGFLNSKPSTAKKQLEELKDFPYTLIFYEAPHRILKTLSLMKEVLGERNACIARELSKVHEEYIRGSFSELLRKEEYRGEIVLEVEGKTKEAEDVEELLRQVRELTDKGMRLKEACEKVSKGTSYSKNQLYTLSAKE